jgi:hypothetical protein
MRKLRTMMIVLIAFLATCGCAGSDVRQIGNNSGTSNWRSAGTATKVINPDGTEELFVPGQQIKPGTKIIDNTGNTWVVGK